MTTIAIELDLPIDLASSLAPFGRWGDDLLDRFDGETLVRTISAVGDRAAVAYSVRVDAGLREQLVVRVGADSPHTQDVVRAVRETFLLDTGGALSRLAEKDPTVGVLSDRHLGHVPVLVPDPFHALIRSISAQQVNLRWASTTRARLAVAYGRQLHVGEHSVHVLDAEALSEATVSDLRALQLTNAKARAVIATARAARDGELEPQELAAMADDELIAHLTRLPGIGRWSAEWFLARTLGRPRVVAGDLAVRKAVGRLYGVALPTENDVRRLTEHWGDAATFAQALALDDLAVRPDPPPAR